MHTLSQNACVSKDKLHRSAREIIIPRRGARLRAQKEYSPSHGRGSATKEEGCYDHKGHCTDSYAEMPLTLVEFVVDSCRIQSRT